MPPERKIPKMNQEGKYLLGAKSERRSMTGDPWMHVQSGKKKRGQPETAGGLRTQHGVDNMGNMGLSTGSRWLTTWNLNTLRGTYAGGQCDANGW